MTCVQKIGTATAYIPGPLPGLNEILQAQKYKRGQKVSYTQMKRDFTALCRSRFLQIKPFRWVNVEIAWPIGIGTKEDFYRDPDDVFAGCKFILDGMVRASVIRDDKYPHVRCIYNTPVEARRTGDIVVLLRGVLS